MVEKVKNTSPSQRKEIILKHLRDHDNVSTEEIAVELSVSEITIRRDLLKLEEKGLLIRTRRGAVKRALSDDLFAYDDKMNQNREAKDYVCKVASSFIKSGDIIFVDCGSTVSLLIHYIKRIDSLTVITNSLPIASELINFENIKLILIGGEIDNKRKAIYGYTAVNTISQYHANKAFIGADGVSLAQGVTSYNERSALTTLKMAENSDEVFLLCDSSKVERNSFVRFAPLSLIDYIITDEKVDRVLVAMYKENDVSLLCE